MLSREDNELICRVGPGTPMGNLMRQYWIPAMLSAELPKPDSDPVRVMLLGEQLIAFRDTTGTIGLLNQSCPHRGASLFFGRNEECGLRCVYHGWKFDSTGACVDMPNEPPESNFKEKVRATAYPTQERGGIVWAYLGQRAEPPPLPDLEPNMQAEGTEVLAAVQRDCNWVQAMEGDIDTSHLGFLHMGALEPEHVEQGTFDYYTVKDRAPRYAVVDTEAGTMYGAFRPAEPPMMYWRIAHFLFPFFTMIPTGVLGRQILVRAWVPMDDNHTLFYSMSVQGGLGGMPRGMMPNSTDWYGRYRLEATASNDYLIDRDKQRRNESYSGLSTIHLEDQAITESMGTVLNRSNEHLGSSDMMVIRVRRRLMEAARALENEGVLPPGVDEPAAYRARSGGVFLREGADWVTETQSLREAFVEHPEISARPKLPISNVRE